MRGSRKFYQRLTLFFIFVIFLAEEGISGAIIGTPAKRHLNGVSLACRRWPNIECWLGSFVIFMGFGPVLLENPIFFVIFQGGADTQPPPLWIRT